MNGHNYCADITAEIANTVSVAEMLLELAVAVQHPRDVILDMSDTETDSGRIERIKTALDLYRKPPVLKFRAIYENWDMQRLVREMY